MVIFDQEFTHRGERFVRDRAPSLDRYIVGVDLGQSSDPTAIAVLHHHVVPLETWMTIRGTNGTNVLRQDRQECFDVRHLERLPLGTPYSQVVEHIEQLIERPPLNRGHDLVIDESGVGRAVGDIFDDAGLLPYRITITSGSEAVEQDNRRWHVPKGVLISALDARLHTGELRFAATLNEANAMADELKDFRRHVGAAGRSTYNARSGKHDDLVLATALAVWWATRRSNGDVSTGFVKGFY
jgi:hypothetical protein